MEQQDLFKRLESAENLPTLPAVAVEVIRLSRDPDTGLNAFADLIARDPALAAKVLRTVNSALYGLSREIRTLQQALTLLGMRGVRALVLSFSLVKLRDPSGDDSLDYTRFWKQSLTNAVSARELCMHHHPDMADEVFLAGLLQDVGMLAMMQVVPDQYQEVVHSAAKPGLRWFQAEREVFQTDHMEVGRWLADRWELPPGLCQSIDWHHEPERADETDEQVKRALQSLYAAALIGELFYDPNKDLPRRLLGELLHAEFAMDADPMDRFLEELAPKIVEAAQVFDMDIGPLADPGSIIAAANAELARLSVEATQDSLRAHERELRLQQRADHLEEERSQLKDQATRDPLTGLFNRTVFDELLSKEYQRGRQYNRGVGLLFADLDHFKNINDTYGHSFGDKVLCLVAKALQEGVRDSDTVARYGGEEFVILVVEPTEKGLQQLAQRLRQAIEQLMPTFEGNPVGITASFGAAICKPRRGDEGGGKNLLEVADKAMYDAKQAGRNCVRFASLVEDSDRQIDAAINALRFSRHLIRRGVVSVQDLTRVLKVKNPTRSKIGALAVKLGMLTEEQMETILKQQEPTNRRFGEIAVARGLLTARQVFWLLAVQKENPQTLGKALVEARVLTLEQLNRELKTHYELTGEARRGAASDRRGAPVRPAVGSNRNPA